MVKRLRDAERGSAKYKKWRESVLRRDGNRCRFGGCDKRDELEVHHIQTFADAEYRRYDVTNGITLCKYHHRNVVTGHEEQYSAEFSRIVANTQLNRKKKLDENNS
jgi:predicted restriction endonuclease